MTTSSQAQAASMAPPAFSIAAEHSVRASAVGSSVASSSSAAPPPSASQTASVSSSVTSATQQNPSSSANAAAVSPPNPSCSVMTTTTTPAMPTNSAAAAQISSSSVMIPPKTAASDSPPAGQQAAAGSPNSNSGQQQQIQQQQQQSVPMNDLNVEVCLPDNAHTWYKAVLEDFDNDSVVVSFSDPNMRPSSSKVPFESVKLIPTPSETPVQFAEGDRCQVYTAREGELVQAWHDGTIMVVRGGFYKFEYLSSGERKNDVLSAEVFRKPDNSPHLERGHLYKYSYPVPEPVPEDMSDMNNHVILKARLPSSKIYFDPSKNELVMITNLDKNVKLFHLFADFHLKFIKQKAAFRKSIEMATKRIAVLKAPKESNMGAGHVEVFTIKEGLMGLAIGAGGINISQARQIHGVKHIQTDNDNTIRIYADSVEAAKRARAILEFSEEVIDIPKDKIPRIIGRQGALIQEMVDRSGVVKVTVEKDNSDRRVSESETTKRLIVRGTVDSIQNMRVLIDYYLEHVESMDEIIAETHQLQQELRSIAGNHNGSGFGAGIEHEIMMFQNPGAPPSLPQQQHHQQQQQQQQPPMHHHPRTGNGGRGNHVLNPAGGHRGGPQVGGHPRRGGRRGQR